MLANCQNLKIRASKYLAFKVLTCNNWSDSISEGRKGDILALYGLCMLFRRHAVVHLHNGVIWTALDKLSMDHQDDLEKCNVHQCYLSRGLFVKLVKHDSPLKILEDNKENVLSLIVGELSVDETSTVDQIIHTGLGVALDTEDINTPVSVPWPRPSASAGCEVDIPRVEQELNQPKTATVSCADLAQIKTLTKEFKIVNTPNTANAIQDH